jgi:hypothetical protein
MIWIVLAIIVVGYFIVNELYKQTQLRQQQTVVAQQQYLNSPEYKNQVKADMAYWNHIGLSLTVDSLILRDKIKLLDPPEIINRPNPNTGKFEPVKDKKEVIRYLRQDLKEQIEYKVDIKEEYEKGKSEYSGYQPADINTIRDRYDFAVPFDSTPDNINETLASSWSMYQDNLNEKNRLQADLDNLKKGIKPHKAHYNAALKLVREKKRASVSFIQANLHIDYGEARIIIDELEKNGAIGPANGIRDREVLHASDN